MGKLVLIIFLAIPNILSAQLYIRDVTKSDSVVITGNAITDTSAALTVHNKIYTKNIKGIRGKVTYADTSEFTGFLISPQTLYFDAVAWLAPLTNGAQLDTLSSREEVYDFVQGIVKKLNLKFYLPPNFTSLDSMQLILSVNSTAGDSAEFTVRAIGIAEGELVTSSFTSSLSVTRDLGSVANARLRLSYPLLSVLGAFSSEDMVQMEIERSILASNDETASVRFHGAIIFYH
ncbi:MAG: hypothetical protein ACE5H1_01170 [Thermodesulfobacteriota bacterium]